MKKYHTLFIGGGINNLVCASLLAKAGKPVLVLERTEHLGGCIRSSFEQDCVIDPLSTAYPLFVTSPAYALLKEDLEKNGVEFVFNQTPIASVLSDKRIGLLTTDRQKNIDNLNKLHIGDGDRYNLMMDWVGQHAGFLFTLLGQELQTGKTARFLAKYVWKNKVKKSLENIGEFLPNIRNNLPVHLKSEEAQAMLAPWVLHTGLSPESPFSATMAKIIAFTVELFGLPLVKGGSYNIVTAFKNIVESNGGECRTGADVKEVRTNNQGKATGVQLSDGAFVESKFVVASANPNQLYGGLIKDQRLVPEDIRQQAENYKYGMGNTQVHIILNKPPQWFNSDLENVVYVHLTDGIDDVSRAVNEARRQQLPANGTICVAQPSNIDPTRSKDGKSVLWIQLPECPNFPAGDAAGKLDPMCKGEWTEELKTAYADRIIERLEKYISNIKTDQVHKQIISPKDLSEMNINLKNGDPYGGLCEMEQYLAWRPLRGVKNHETPIKNLYHNGASTHPGPGLGGAGGVHIAEILKKK